MTDRQHKVNFRDLLEKYDSDADELEEIQRIIPMWVKRFEGIELLKHFASGFKKVKTLAQFDKHLARIYDYCDANLIWVEL